MSLIDQSVRDALRTVLTSALPDSMISYQNESFEAVRRPWVRETLLPGIPERIELGPTGSFRVYGTYQLDIFTPEGEGVRAAEDIAETIAGAFSPGTGYGDDLTVYVRRVYTQSAVQTAGWFSLPVMVDWFVTT
jgi:hypothetical protein